jgi:hypothetical protein
MSTRVLFALLLALTPTFAGAAKQAGAVKRDTTERLAALRKITLGKQTAPAQQKLSVKKASAFYKTPAMSISVADAVRGTPKYEDVTINQGFDGRTPQQALAFVRSKLTTKVAAQNDSLVDKTILGAHKSFTLAVNNVFVKGSPSNTRMAGEWAGAEVTVLGVMSQVHPVVMMVKKPTDKVARYFSPAAGGGYEELSKLSYKVIMKAQLEDGSKAGVRVSYQTWAAPTLSGPISNVVELSSKSTATE